jgi:hypothetical protein
MEKNIYKIGGKLYVTSDEEIKEGGWVILTNKEIIKAEEADENPKRPCKIILTTDPDLIKEGVQAIDDTFLEWFVKNPSCEFVEIYQDKKDYGSFQWYSEYKIIIPQGEPKQETLEEVAYNYASKKLQRPITIYTSLDANVAEYVGFIKGAKWQQERMYSEEEVKQIIEATLIEYSDFVLADIPEWFEKFKKKQNEK